MKDDYDLEVAVPYLANRVGVRIGEAFSEELKHFGLTLAAWRVLASLAHHESQTLSSLAEHTTVELSTLSRLVVGLQKKDLLRRIKNTDDKRSVLLSLSPAGEALAARIIPLARVYERVALSGLSSQEAALLRQLLAKVYANIASLSSQNSS